MSRYRQTMESALREVYKLNEKDHEISMARGELEAIADKATQLASMLQSKSDEGNPLEAWVQSKITKAKDYINSVSDYMMYNPDMKQNEGLEEKTYGWTLVSKAKDLAKKFKDNMTKAVAEIEKLEKGLSKNPTVDAELRKYNENLEEKYTVVITKKDGTTMELGKYNTSAEAQRYVDQYGKGAKVKKEEVEFELDEGRMKDIYTMQQDGKSSEEIAKYLKMPIKTVKSILGEEMGEVSEENLDEFTSDMIKRLKKSYSTMPQKLSTDQANALSRHLDRLDLTSLKQLAKEKIPFISTLAKNKIYKKTGKFEQLEEQDDVIKPEGESDIEGLKKQLVTAQGQISVLKQKLENEKNKAIKPTPNPETGEVPLTIGIANKLLKDKEKKEAEEKKQKEASKQIQSMAKGGEETKLEFFTKKYLSHLNESEASDKAKALGLTYMSFGRYGKDGQVTHKSVGGSLKALSKKDQETEKDTDKPSKPKTKTTGSIKNPDGSNTTSGSIKKEILKKIEDEDLTDPDMLHQFDDELSNLADDLRQTGDRETADKILDALDSVADGDISSDAPSKIEDMINALKGKPDFNTQYQKELGKMTNLYKDAKYSKQNIKDFIKDTDSIINKMSQVVEVGSQDSADYGMTVRSDAVTELAYTCTEIQDKLDEMDIDKDTKDSIYDELDTIASKNDEDNADEKEIVMAIERLKYEFKKLNKKKLKKESFNEERRLYVESIAAVKNKAEKTGMPYNILKQVYDRGMAAWKGGHRPGATQVQWALARVNSFVTKSSGTWGGADKDLAKQVKG
jgi:hypothetical protein